MHNKLQLYVTICKHFFDLPCAVKGEISRQNCALWECNREKHLPFIGKSKLRVCPVKCFWNLLILEISPPCPTLSNVLDTFRKTTGQFSSFPNALSIVVNRVMKRGFIHHPQNGKEYLFRHIL